MVRAVAPQMTQPSITIVIPAHNAENVLGEQLESLCEQNYDGIWDVLVVDNMSTDETSKVARSFGQRLRVEVIHADKTSSASYARNVGIKAATGEWILFLDADDVAGPRLLEAYAREMHRFSVLGGRLDDAPLNDPTVAAWRYSLSEYGLPIALGRFPFLLTSNCAVRREVFETVGVFDETLRYFGEDVDLSIRIGLAGLTLAGLRMRLCTIDTAIRYEP